jgi:hypothetical protein
MLLVRDVFSCKPGKSMELAERFKKTFPSMKASDGFVPRVMVDLVADYWTVVLEAEVEDLSAFERHMREYRDRPEVRQAMDGYMDLVKGGRREIYTLV